MQSTTAILPSLSRHTDSPSPHSRPASGLNLLSLPSSLTIAISHPPSPLPSPLLTAYMALAGGANPISFPLCGCRRCRIWLPSGPRMTVGWSPPSSCHCCRRRWPDAVNSFIHQLSIPSGNSLCHTWVYVPASIWYLWSVGGSYSARITPRMSKATFQCARNPR